MYDLVVNGVEYTNVVYKDKQYIIQRTGEGQHRHQNNRFRLVNTEGEDNHTHLNSMGVCKKCIEMVEKSKIPRVAHKYFIMSCYRLSMDEEYKGKVLDLYHRKRDRQRQAYVR